VGWDYGIELVVLKDGAVIAEPLASMRGVDASARSRHRGSITTMVP
jgi:hypothetical protein